MKPPLLSAARWMLLAVAVTALAPTAAAEPAAKDVSESSESNTEEETSSAFERTALFDEQGRPYVPTQNIREFYHFQDFEVSDDDVVFRSPTMAMRTRIASDYLYIHDNLFRLSHPVIRIGPDICVSRLDLAKVIDPVLRPTYVKPAFGTGLRNVVVESTSGNDDSVVRELMPGIRLELEKAGLSPREADGSTSRERIDFANEIEHAILIVLDILIKRDQGNTLQTFTLAPEGTSPTGVTHIRPEDKLQCPGNHWDTVNVALATAIHASIKHALADETRPPVTDLGISRSRNQYLAHAGMPACMIKLQLKDRELLTVVATAIANGTVNCRRAISGR